MTEVASAPRASSAPPAVAWRVLAPALLLAALGLAVAVALPRSISPPLLMAGLIAVLVGTGAVVVVVRALGARAWMAAVPLSILAGELSAVSLGGQSGRLLWADAVVLGGAAVALARERMTVTLPRSAVLGWTVALVAWSAVTLPFAGDPLTAVAELKEWVVAAIAGLAVLRLAARPRDARLALGAVSVTGAAIGVAMLVTAVRSPYGALMAIVFKKVDLSWGRTNYLAGILILAMAIALGLAASATRRRDRLAWTAVLALAAMGLVLSASKGAMLALVVGLLVAYLPAGRSSRVGVGVLAALLVVGAALFVAGPLRQVFAYRMQESALAYSVGERTHLYALAWDRFLHAPLTGIGLNNFSVAANRLTGVDTVPHNFALGYLAELGLIGFAIASAWLVAALRVAWHAVRRAPTSHRGLALAAWSGLVGFAVHNQFESTIYGEQYKLMLFVVLAALPALTRAEQTVVAAPR